MTIMLDQAMGSPIRAADACCQLPASRCILTVILAAQGGVTGCGEDGLDRAPDGVLMQAPPCGAARHTDGDDW